MQGKYEAKLTNKNIQSFFQSDLFKEFIDAAVQGDPATVKRTLAKDPKMLLERTDIMDMSGRLFKNCTAFEYVVWALDVKFMAQDMINSLPENKLGESIRIDLKKQLDNLCNNGITYILNGKTYRESHFDIEPVRQAYQLYIDCCDDWNDQKQQQCWAQIAKLQRLFPVNIVQHFCDPLVTIDKNSNFKNKTFYRITSVFDCSTSINTEWFELLTKIEKRSEECAILRLGNYPRTVQNPSKNDCYQNQAGLLNLVEQRMRNDMKELMTLVSTSLLNENQLSF